MEWLVFTKQKHTIAIFKELLRTNIFNNMRSVYTVSVGSSRKASRNDAICLVIYIIADLSSQQATVRSINAAKKAVIINNLIHHRVYFSVQIVVKVQELNLDSLPNVMMHGWMHVRWLLRK